MHNDNDNDNDEAWELVRQLEHELNDEKMWCRVAWMLTAVLLVLIYLHFACTHGFV